MYPSHVADPTIWMGWFCRMLDGCTGNSGAVRSISRVSNAFFACFLKLDILYSSIYFILSGGFMVKRYLLIWSILLVSGCSVYSFRSTNLPPEIKTIYIPIFESDLTGEELIVDIKEIITTAVQDEFVSITSLTLADEENADAVFIGRLKSYSRDVSNYDQSENPTDYKITLSIQGEFRNLIAEDVVWQQTDFSRDEYYVVDETKDDLGEQEALDKLVEITARDLVSAATENW